MKLSKYAKFLENNENFIIYHSQLGNACKVDKNIFNILNNIKNYSSNLSENNKEIFEEFKDRNIIVEDNIIEKDYLEEFQKKQIRTSKSGEQIKTIQLIVSNNCNFNCKYCFENKIYCSPERELNQNDKNNKIMKAEDAIDYINKIISIKKKNLSPSLHIQFFGGEPLTNKECIKSVLDYFKNGQLVGIDISYSIVTNGSLIDANIAEYFKKYNVAVIISFDNPKQKDREMKSGKSSVIAVYNSLNILKNYNVYTAFNSVLSSFTYNYFDTDIIDCALKYNVKEVGIVLDLSPEFYKKFKPEDIANKILNLIYYGEKNNVLISGYWMSTYLALIDRNEYKKGFKTCSATGNQLSIEPNGEIFACKGSSGYFGNIESLDDLFASDKYINYLSRALKNSEKCNNCTIEGFCSGFCLGPLEQNYQNINYVIKDYCKLMKLLINNLLKNEKELDYYVYD